MDAFGFFSLFIDTGGFESRGKLDLDWFSIQDWI
jgi:hypothetical protein